MTIPALTIDEMQDEDSVAEKNIDLGLLETKLGAGEKDEFKEHVIELLSRHFELTK